MKVYHVENKQVTEVALPEDAPVDIETALGEEISGRGDFNYSAQGAPNSSGEGVAYHGFSAKDEEVEIDHVNYYQAVDNYFKNEFPNEENLPLYLLHSLKIKHYLRRLQKQVSSKRCLYCVIACFIIPTTNCRVCAKIDGRSDAE